MRQPRPDHAVIENELGRADAAVNHSRDVRRRYRRRRGAARRDEHLAAAKARCEQIAIPIRSWLGMVAWGGIELEDEIAMKAMMERLRYERRQITKMLKAAAK